MKQVFETVRSGGHILREYWDGKDFQMKYSSGDSDTALSMYEPASLGKEEKRIPYGGLTVDAIFASGKDLLTERLLAGGEPSYQKVEALLPKVEEGAYAFLGGAASWSGIELDAASGVLYSQVCGNVNTPTEALFDPSSEDCVLGRCRPVIVLLDGRFPIAIAVHTDGKDALEFLYFVEAGDPDRDPVVWIRTKRYALADPSAFVLRHQIVSRSRVIFQHEIAEDTFYTALADTAAYWLHFAAAGTAITIPEKRLERVVSGTQIACGVTFSGDHPHYGHRYYGKEFHDHFPPNFLWSIEMCCVQNRIPWARRIVQHLFAYSLTDEGRFVYRQGNDELFGASACEYAQLLRLLRCYADVLGIGADYLEQLRGMGRYLLSYLRPCPELGGKKLIYMCAEADSNTRVHAYINNNLWCVHGFGALADLLDRLGCEAAEGDAFRQYADELYEAVLAVLEKDGLYDERFGYLPPFRFGYTAAPATLSGCRDTFFPMNEEEYAGYARWIDMREQGESGQEYTENCYANYRYYPEMLGAMLLPREFAQGTAALRRNLGGEVLCMTRFMNHLDDWPVLHYARFLLETGDTDRFLTLLYAHACHHGRPDLLCYYEQVGITGKVMAEDCVPSLLTVPIMAAWMFAYENITDRGLSLLAGVPAAWYESGFSAENVGLSFGTVSIEASASRVSVRFSSAPDRPFRLVLRHRRGILPANFQKGGEAVLGYEDGALVIAAGMREITIAWD